MVRARYRTTLGGWATRDRFPNWKLRPSLVLLPPCDRWRKAPMRQLLWAKRHQHYPRYPRPQNVGSGISVRHASRPHHGLLARSATARLRLDVAATGSRVGFDERLGSRTVIKLARRYKTVFRDNLTADDRPLCECVTEHALRQSIGLGSMCICDICGSDSLRCHMRHGPRDRDTNIASRWLQSNGSGGFQCACPWPCR